jgi:hypothetical protein
MSERRDHLFLLRAFNDTDNITPAIHHLLDHSGDSTADVLVYSDDFAFHQDRNLRHLTDTFGSRIRVRWIGEALGLPYRHLAVGGRTPSVLKIAGRLRPRWSVRRTVADDRPSAERAVDWLFPDGVPEHVIADQNRSDQVRALVSALRSRGARRVVALPVSPLINFNIMRMTRFVSRNPRIENQGIEYMHDYSVFDRVGFTDRYYLDSLARYYRSCGRTDPLSQKSTVLGSLRFSKRWIARRDTIFPMPEGWEAPPAEKRVVFFLSKQKNNTHWEEVERTLALLSDYPEISVIVKPHTRNMGFALLRAFPNIHVESDLDSSILIRGTDACLVWGSSVALDAYQRGTPVIYLRHVHANRALYETFGAGRIVASRDELKYALDDLLGDRLYREGDEARIEDMLLHMVHAGDASTPLEDRYREFMHR